MKKEREQSVRFESQQFRRYSDKELKDYPPLSQRNRDRNTMSSQNVSSSNPSQDLKQKKKINIKGNKEESEDYSDYTDFASSDEEFQRKSRRFQKKSNKRGDKRKAPKTSVITIGKESETISYADILKNARSNISLNELGIEKQK